MRLSKTLLDYNGWHENWDRRADDLEDSDDDEFVMHMAPGEETFVSYWECQRMFIKLGGARKMLSEILSLLPNLKTLAFGEWEVSAEDTFNDKFNYFKKGMYNHLRSWRYPVEEAEKYEDACTPKDEGFREVNAVLQALADSRKPIENFYIRSYSLYENWIDLQRVAPLVPPLSEGLTEAFKRLRTLHLAVGENQELLYHEEEDDEEALDDNGNYTLWLAEFLALTPQVEELT